MNAVVTHIDRDRALCRVVLDGTIDEAVMDGLTRHECLHADLPLDFAILVDARGAAWRGGITDTHRLIRWSERIPAGRIARIAIVTTRQVEFGMWRKFVPWLNARGCLVEITRDRDHALLWLGTAVDHDAHGPRAC